MMGQIRVMCNEKEITEESLLISPSAREMAFDLLLEATTNRPICLKLRRRTGKELEMSGQGCCCCFFFPWFIYLLI